MFPTCNIFGFSDLHAICGKLRLEIDNDFGGVLGKQVRADAYCGVKEEGQGKSRHNTNPGKFRLTFSFSSCTGVFKPNLFCLLYSVLC